MSDGQRRHGRWTLPSAGRAIWGTVAVSTLSYFVFGRAVANIAAVVGGILVTYILITRSKDWPGSQD